MLPLERICESITDIVAGALAPSFYPGQQPAAYPGSPAASFPTSFPSPAAAEEK